MRCGHCGEMVEDPTTHKCASAPTLWHQSGVNSKGEPFIQLILNDKVIVQVTPEQARAHGWSMLEVAEAAEQDAFIFDWVINCAGAGPEQAAGLLADFRRYREARTGKKNGPSKPEDWVMPRND